jgi:hypothetical protein
MCGARSSGRFRDSVFALKPFDFGKQALQVNGTPVRR